MSLQRLSTAVADVKSRGPLLFCLLLSLFLSFRAPEDQKSLVFSGVFAIVWIGEAVVTIQIKLLGGNMYGLPQPFLRRSLMLQRQIIFPIGVHHWLYTLSFGHCLATQCSSFDIIRTDPGIHCPCIMVIGGRSQHSRRFGCREESVRYSGIPAFPLLCQLRLFMPHYVMVESIEASMPKKQYIMSRQK